MLKNTEENWGSVSRWLHWSMAVLLLAQVALGKIGHEMARSPAKLDVLTWHKSIGVLLLLLVLARLAWRWLNPAPVAPESMTAWQIRLARLTHAVLYALIVALPLSGWVLNSASNFPMKVFWLVPWPDITGPSTVIAEAAEEVHESLAAVLVTLMVVHVLAALWHHFVAKDRVLLNMLGRRRHAA